MNHRSSPFANGHAGGMGGEGTAWYVDLHRYNRSYRTTLGVSSVVRLMYHTLSISQDGLGNAENAAPPGAYSLRPTAVWFHHSLDRFAACSWGLQVMEPRWGSVLLNSRRTPFASSAESVGARFAVGQKGSGSTSDAQEFLRLLSCPLWILVQVTRSGSANLHSSTTIVSAS